MLPAKSDDDVRPKLAAVDHPRQAMDPCGLWRRAGRRTESNAKAPPQTRGRKTLARQRGKLLLSQRYSIRGGGIMRDCCQRLAVIFNRVALVDRKSTRLNSSHLG